MKVLLINGSPHKQGCTYTALSEVASSLNEEGIETDFYWIGNKPIGGCVGCFACAKKKQCVFDDRGMISGLYRTGFLYGIQGCLFCRGSNQIGPGIYDLETGNM